MNRTLYVIYQIYRRVLNMDVHKHNVERYTFYYYYFPNDMFRQFDRDQVQHTGT